MITAKKMKNKSEINIDKKTQMLIKVFEQKIQEKASFGLKHVDFYITNIEYVKSIKKYFKKQGFKVWKSWDNYKEAYKVEIDW